jgi:hypothetical protein
MHGAIYVQSCTLLAHGLFDLANRVVNLKTTSCFFLLLTTVLEIKLNFVGWTRRVSLALSPSFTS